MNIFKHPCNTCFIKPICKEPECSIVKDHYRKMDQNAKIAYILITTFLFVFIAIPFFANSPFLTIKDFSQLTAIFYLLCSFILFVLAIFIMCKSYIRRMNELNRIDKFFFQKVEE
jgi:uncharacterized membrane protein (DUF485 family)